jgi:outer membrane protein assembly factor BamB
MNFFNTLLVVDREGNPMRCLASVLFSPASFALALTLSSSLVRGEEPKWSQFRGPDANPVSAHTQLPERWSKTENVEWFVEIPGRGWSSPIVTAGKVFLTTVITEGKSKGPQIGTEYSNEYAAELEKQGLSGAQVQERVMARDFEMPNEVMLHYILYCLDLKTGVVIWRKEIYAGRPPGGRHRKNSFVSETPVTDGEFVYVYVGNLKLFAYDLKGEQAWATPLEAYPIYFDFGTGSSLALNGNRLLILNDNEKQQFLAAFDKETGKCLWRTDRDVKKEGEAPRRSGWTTPYVWSNKLRTEIVTIGPGVAVSYDMAGKELWRLSGMSVIPVPSPFAYDGLLYIDAGLSGPLFAIRPGASGDISLSKADKSNEYVVWSEPRGGTYLPTPVAYEGGLYVLSEKGILSRFDAKTGKLNYKTRVGPEADAFTSSPWAYNGKILCLSEEGKTYVVAAGETFKLLQVNPLDEMALATPAIAGERLLIRTESRLYSIRQMRPHR